MRRVRCLGKSRSASVSGVAQHQSCFCIRFFWRHVKWSLLAQICGPKRKERAHSLVLKEQGIRCVAASKSPTATAFWKQTLPHDNPVKLSCSITIKSFSISEVPMLNLFPVQSFTPAFTGNKKCCPSEMRCTMAFFLTIESATWTASIHHRFLSKKSTRFVLLHCVFGCRMLFEMGGFHGSLLFHPHMPNTVA